MTTSRTTLAACLVLQGAADTATLAPALEQDLRGLVAVADEVVVYDTADHLTPGSAAFEATLHPAVTVVSGFWADDRERAQEAALAHVGADWALCVLAGERVTTAPDLLRDLLQRAVDVPAMSVRVDDVVRGTHRSARLLHRGCVSSGAFTGAVAEVPSSVLTVHQPVATTARVPAQRGVFDRV
ncbi:hypothetical protein [Kineococcus rhizosphaerae]|uniref:Glycosyl transferase family 2 n=1 Tax=Kineococcus rhizosphaerae TaxID=559628 RepID=A0A2T0RAS3_9ACTN|nr:hypothetical protein [Kineococcus rhizosphaerae]PRY18240.1 hypothetical protein CLV37_101485 [Kineococcus rhizosphaerae]